MSNFIVDQQRQRFYAFAQGYDRPETVGTLAEVEAALGLSSLTMPAERGCRLRTYCVTVTPEVVYTGLQTDGEYELEVRALTRNAAIRRARDHRRNEDGAYTVPAKYRARLVSRPN